MIKLHAVILLLAVAKSHSQDYGSYPSAQGVTTSWNQQPAVTINTQPGVTTTTTTRRTILTQGIPSFSYTPSNDINTNVYTQTIPITTTRRVLTVQNVPQTVLSVSNLPQPQVTTYEQAAPRTQTVLSVVPQAPPPPPPPVIVPRAAAPPPQPVGPAKPYRFNYITDDTLGTTTRREEESDGNSVRGSYSYLDSDGVFRTVDYIADEGGFRANVRTNEPGTEKTANQADPANTVWSVEPPPAVVLSRYSPDGKYLYTPSLGGNTLSGRRSSTTTTSGAAPASLPPPPPVPQPTLIPYWSSQPQPAAWTESRAWQQPQAPVYRTASPGWNLGPAPAWNNWAAWS